MGEIPAVNMSTKLRIRIETTPAQKTIFPWVAVTRPGRQSVDSFCFALIGYPGAEREKLQGATLEAAHDTITSALRHLGAFEYIPNEPHQLDSFFEKKIVAFEERMRETPHELPALSAAVGIVQATKILFATAGDILALQITSSEIVNLGEPTRGGHFHFETFRSGTLGLHSYLIFIPKTSGVLLKSDELRQLYLARGSERKLDYLDHLIQKRAHPSGALRAILLEAKPQFIKTTETTAVSIAHLLTTEAKTEELLSPPLVRPIIKRLKIGTLTISRYLKKLVVAAYATRKTPVRIRRDSQPARPPGRTAPTLSISRAVPAAASVQSAAGAPRTLSSVLIALTGRFKARANLGRIRIDRQRLNTLFNFSRPIERFNLLPYRSKFLLLFSMLLVFTFSEGVLFTANRNKVAKAETLIEEEVGAIRSLIDSANASLIYRDEKKAQTEAWEAKRRIETLPDFQTHTLKTFGLRSLRATRSPITAATLGELQSALAPLEQKLRRAIVIDAPSPIGAFAANTPHLTGEASTSAAYRSRLYTLNPQRNQILKHEKKGDGFDEGAPWVQDGTDIAGVTALAVDGAIYVSEPSGKVLRLLRGRRTSFELAPLDPSLRQIKKIWTNEASDYLYLLDPIDKRLVVFAKRDGLLQAQYVSPAFSDLRDFAVDEQKKTAYLLDGTTVVSIPLSHLQK